MTLNAFLLEMVTIGAVLTGVFVITSKNPVLSVLFLILVFINVAIYLVFHNTTYLALTYIVVYVGAIAILFLFVIMMLNIKSTDLVSTGSEYTQNLPLGTLLAIVFLLEMLAILPSGSSLEHTSGFTSLLSPLTNLFAGLNVDVSNTFVKDSDTSLVQLFSYSSAESFANVTQIESIGFQLYTGVAIWLLITGCIFITGIVGPIVLCMEGRPAAQPEMDHFDE